MASFFDTSIEFLKGVGPQRAALLQKELEIFTFGDLLQHYPFRYEDRTKFYSIKEVTEEMPYVQIVGKITRMEIVGGGFKKRLVGQFTDGTGTVELVWFQAVQWVFQKIKPGIAYVVFGKPNRFGKNLTIAHPEVEPVSTGGDQGGYLQPVYPLSEKLRTRRIDSKVISKLQQELLRVAQSHVRETLPDYLLKKFNFIGKLSNQPLLKPAPNDFHPGDLSYHLDIWHLFSNLFNAVEFRAVFIAKRIMLKKIAKSENLQFFLQKSRTLGTNSL